MWKREKNKLQYKRAVEIRIARSYKVYMNEIDEKGKKNWQHRACCVKVVFFLFC